MKIIYLDTETTGLDSSIHDILQICMIFEDMNTKRLDTIALNMRPYNIDNIDMSALRVNGITQEELMKFPYPQEAYVKLIDFLSRNLQGEIAYPVAYNGTFDLDFLKIFFKRHGDDMGKYINWRLLDPLQLIRFLEFAGVLLPIPNHKLGTVLSYFDIHIEYTHNAIYDCQGTMRLFHKLLDIISSIGNINK